MSTDRQIVKDSSTWMWREARKEERASGGEKQAKQEIKGKGRRRRNARKTKRLRIENDARLLIIR